MRSAAKAIGLSVLILASPMSLQAGTATLQAEFTASDGLDLSHDWKTCGVSTSQTADACYLARYPDVAADAYYGTRPFQHFVDYGQREGRRWGCDAAISSPNEPFNMGNGTHGIQCVTQPGRVVGFIGTSTIKAADVEVLAWIMCNNVVIWQGEHRGAGTVPIQMSGLNDPTLTGPCWMGVQSVAQALHMSVYELQVTIFFQ